MIKFNFCPDCSSKNIEQDLENSIKCGDCGFIYFHNVAAAAGAVIEKDGKILMCVRERDPQKGKLDLPGGFVSYGETVEQALKREILEETGASVKSLCYFMSAVNDYEYKNVLYPTVDMYFKCALESYENLKAMDDVEQLIWIELKDIDFNKLAFPSTKKVIEMLISKRVFY